MGQDKAQHSRFIFISLLLVLPLLLSGCLGSGYWVWQHPDGLSNAALQEAKLECRQLAERQVDRFDYYYPAYYGPYYDDYFFWQGHHRPYYWRQPLYDFHRYNRDLDRLYNVCMQAKGWQLIYYDPPPEASKP